MNVIQSGGLTPSRLIIVKRRMQQGSSKAIFKRGLTPIFLYERHPERWLEPIEIHHCEKVYAAGIIKSYF
jgi:hypothetical protein